MDNLTKMTSELQISKPTKRHRQPQNSCCYCGIHNAKCLVRCNTCQKWFCNWIGKTFSSHIIMHLVHSKHHEVTLHREGPLGETCFKCSLCCCQNVFMLGYVDEKISPTTAWFCRLPCSLMHKKENDDTNVWPKIDHWNPLVVDNRLTDMVVNEPSAGDVKSATPLPVNQIRKLEELWRMNQDGSFDDGYMPTVDPVFQKVPLRYESVKTYRNIFAPLVKLEENCDKAKSRLSNNINFDVLWEMAHERVNAFIRLDKIEDIHLMHGNRVSLTCAGRTNGHTRPWTGVGYVFKVPKNLDKTIGICLDRGSIPPMNHTQGFMLSFLWNPTAYLRMQKALQKFAEDEASVSVYIFRRMLGHAVEDVRFECSLPDTFSAPSLPTLNESQMFAVKMALQQSVSLIQGPPGTGKTVTSASLIYHLSKQNKGPILVCAPSNTAVDHLAEKIHMTGLKVVRLCSKSREELISPLAFLSLQHLVRNMDGQPELKEFQLLKDVHGRLAPADDRTYRSLLRNCELIHLRAADVICCTCVCAGDRRLDGFTFETVLIDESTQAVEPECLIPIVKEIKQIILVGDHCQLGPVVVSPKAASAGFGTSLFQRFLGLGSRPFVLNQQYRMHPELSKFPSKLFYDGALKDGISADDRQCDTGFPWPTTKPMFFYAVSGVEEISGTGISFLNRMEASFVVKIVCRLLSCGVKSNQIGIITPYDGQRTHILEYMQLCGSLHPSQYQELEVASVDGFQGREKDYIILSCVRSNKVKRVGFLNDPRRLNVAITRARYGLIILGDAMVLAKHTLWNHLLTYYKEQNVLMEGSLDCLQHCDLQFDEPKELVNKLNPQNHFMDLAMFESSSVIIPGNFSNSECVTNGDLLLRDEACGGELVDKLNPQNHFVDLAALESSSVIIPDLLLSDEACCGASSVQCSSSYGNCC